MKERFLKNPITFVLACLVLLLIGVLLKGKNTSHNISIHNTSRVVGETLQVETLYPKIIFHGELVPNRSIMVYSQISVGTVEKILFKKGEKFKKDQVLLRFAPEDRQERLNEAEARLEQRKLEHKAALKLTKQSFRSENSLAEAKANLDQAAANLSKIQVEINHSIIKAPFDGVLENHFVEEGSPLNQMDLQLLHLVELDPLKVICFIPEKDRAGIVEGMQADISFPLFKTTEPYKAKVFSVSKYADEKTRCFRIELLVENHDFALPSGLTTKVVLSLPPQKGYKVKPSLLTLHEDGQIGIKGVVEQKVVFYPASILEASPDLVTLGNLPDQIYLITRGADFVKEGQVVEVVDDEPSKESAQ